MTALRHIHESTMLCAGCGAEFTGAYPFRCPRADAGGDADHVLARLLNPEWVRFPADSEPNPFVRYRALLRSYHVARAHGMTDGAYVALVREFDEAVARVDGRGFTETPCARDPVLSDRLGFTSAGGVWVKDESGNVSGSHKGRHLAGIMIYLQVLERVGLVSGEAPPLAIASCGNAALAAAVVARAADRQLSVFIPPNAPPTVVERLRDLGARVSVCRREPGGVGDPCYHAFRAAVSAGALPFCCQGNENGLTIEGGETLAYEMVSQFGGRLPDRILVQVGGGALASAIVHGFSEAVSLSVSDRAPRLHAVQTRGAYPLKRAFDEVTNYMRARAATPAAALQYAVAHRSEFMRPWEQEPRSLAHGILDDETYDWFAVVRGMLDTGGSPIVVEEQELAETHALANARRDGRVAVDHTGIAGLAGLRQLKQRGEIGSHESTAVIFSGAERG